MSNLSNYRYGEETSQEPYIAAIELDQAHPSWTTVPTAVNTQPNLTFQIAAGVAIGILSAAAIGWAYTEWRADQAIRAFTAQMEQAARDLRIQRINAIHQENARQLEANERVLQANQQMAAQQRAEEASKRQALEAASRREAAWATFYQKPQRCIDNPSSQTLMDCANEHIRAKRDFERQYVAQ